MRKILQDILDQGLGRFQSLCLFYQVKNRDNSFGLFSCTAGECFPEGWLKSIEAGVWKEEGKYGDNFREAFDLKKQ